MNSHNANSEGFKIPRYLRNLTLPFFEHIDTQQSRLRAVAFRRGERKIRRTEPNFTSVNQHRGMLPIE
ncbi:hypothetical protein [Pectobacterium polaris]|uniref:hypothetical protein n=1 Tax=Pectobacterium polaris TaxID=2042057 RepID=UPI001F4499DD|nr:hypothetical protein [Pectobacterium polaris]